MRGTRFPFARFRPVLFVILSLAVLAASQPGRAQTPEVTVSLGDTGFSIGNTYLTRSFLTTPRWTGTWSVTNRLSSLALPPLPEEFAFTLMDGARVSSRDFTFTGRIDERLDGGGRRLIFTFRHNGLGVDAQAAYTLFPDDFFMRKTVRLRCDPGRSVHVDSVVVEHFLGVQGTVGGGLGQPVFLDQHMFAGLEHPAGRSVVDGEDVQLTHFPGWTLNGQWQESFAAVLGSAPEGIGPVRQAFTMYLQRIRRPPRALTLYNSWFDIRTAGMGPDTFLSLFNTINGALGKYGARLDSVVVDDGWQDPDTLWNTNPETFPAGLAPLGGALREAGGELGLWLPLCGHTLRLPFHKDVPLEVSPEGHYFCMSGPKYNAALRTRLRELIVDHGVRNFKHDFNYFNCTGTGAGYMPTPDQSFEANTSAMAGLLDFMHDTNPSVFSNITSHMWLSPWWLKHADTVWIGSADYGYNLTVPAIEPRDQSITYYDARIYDMLIRKEQQFPPYALMTHGIIDGRLNRLGGEREPFLAWVNNVMMYLGRGVQMRELYITPSLLSGDQWKALAQGLKWAKTKDDVFPFYGHMIGGIPERGDIYGYEFFNERSEVITLRNPDFAYQNIRLQMAYPGNILRIVYPYHMWNDGLTIDNAGRLNFPMGDHQVVVMESVPKDTVTRPVLRGVRSRVIRQDETSTEYEIRTTPGTTRFFLASSVPVHQVTQNGKTLTPTATGAYYGEAPGESVSASKPLQAWSNTNLAADAADMELGTVVKAGMVDPEFVLYLSSAADEFVPAQLEFDGRTATAAAVGQGWAAFRMPVEFGSHTHHVRIRPRDVAATPFATDGFAITSFAGGWFPGVPGRVVVRHDPAPVVTEDLPLPVSQDLFRIMDMNARNKIVRMQNIMPQRTFPGPGKITAAKLRIRVFGNHGGTPAAILLNGTPVGSVPGSSFPFTQWETFVLDIPQAQINMVRADNKLVITTLDNRAFQFTGLGLSVRLADGAWLNSNLFEDTLNTDPDWEFARGRSFTGRSPAIRLSFP